MKKYADGKYIEMTEEDLRKHAELGVPSAPSLEARLEALEAAMLEQLLGGAADV